MNSLNVFNNCFSPWRYPSNWFRNIKCFGKCLKYCYQRITRGYCNSDVWDLDSTYLDLFHATLKDLANNTHSWPDRLFKTPEEWTQYLHETADCFYRANEWNYYYKNEYEPAWRIDRGKEVKDKYLKRELEIIKLREADFEEGMKRLHKIFFDLWD